MRYKSSVLSLEQAFIKKELVNEPVKVLSLRIKDRIFNLWGPN